MSVMAAGVYWLPLFPGLLPPCESIVGSRFSRLLTVLVATQDDRPR